MDKSGVLRHSRFDLKGSQRFVYRVLNTRSQKKSYNWGSFKAMWKTLDIPNPKNLETYQPRESCLF
jgi:hypothetical protein